MNAYKLADEYEYTKKEHDAFMENPTDANRIAVLCKRDEFLKKLIRQQEDRIAELEGEVSHLKHINKNWSISEGLALQTIAELKDQLSFYEIKDLDSGLKTKPLSDEEIDKIIYLVDWAYNPVLLARAIEERHGIK